MSVIKIAIVGAGPGGLTMANLLQKNDIPFTLYDLDASPNERNQGGSLDLHPKMGQLALREAGLWDEFTKHARPESDCLKLVTNQGEVLWDENTVNSKGRSEEQKFDHRPEIDRSALKQVLLSTLRSDSLKWGKKLKEVVPAEGDRYDLHFADGTIEQGSDLVVGADGAWSKVRLLLSDVKPHYSGISALETWAMDVETKSPWMAEYAGKGSCYSFGEGRSIQIQRQGDGSLRTYACLRKPESFFQDCGIDWTKPDEARKEYVQRYFDDCGEDLKRMVLEASDYQVARPLYMLPVGFRWDPRPGVTLLGDAGHMMTPFAGVGVNVAMADGLELARAVIAHHSATDGRSLTSFVTEYEAALFPRGEMFAQKTVNNMRKHFSANGTHQFANMLKEAFGTGK